MSRKPCAVAIDKGMRLGDAIGMGRHNRNACERQAEIDQETVMVGLRQKVMGQVNLVLAGLGVISDAGSFTLTSGVLDRDPIRMGTNAATANGALAGFVTGAAIEMPRGLRVNVVSS